MYLPLSPLQPSNSVKLEYFCLFHRPFTWYIFQSLLDPSLNASDIASLACRLSWDE